MKGELLHEYRKNRKELRGSLKCLDKEIEIDKVDIKIINSMIRDMDYVIKWLDAGVMPEEGSQTKKALKSSEDFVYGVDGYWDDSIGSFVGVSETIKSFTDNNQEVIDIASHITNLDGDLTYIFVYTILI